MKSKAPLSLLLVIAMTIGGSVLAADRYVDDDDVTCGGNSPCYATINAAFAAVAVDGETISVAAGTYAEHLDIDRPVDLIGAGAGVTTIVSSNTAAEFLIRLGANVPITFSQGMVLEGFTLTGDLDGDSDLLMIRARTGDPGDPIIVRNNVFDCVTNTYLVKGIESRAGGDISNVVVENNQFINECRYPMFLNSAINWLIQGNTFDNGWNAGLQINTSDVDQTHDIQILDNTFTGNTARPDRGDFLPNQYLAAIGLGSTVYNVEVKGNSIQDNFGHSISIGNRTNIALTGVIVSCNDIVNNEAGALNELPANVIDSENNWWGDASGPGGVGPGTGDAVTDGFDFDPWLGDVVGPDCPAPPQVPAAMPFAVAALAVVILAMLSWVFWRSRRKVLS